MKIYIKYKHDNTIYNCNGIKKDNRIVFNSNGDNLVVNLATNYISIEKTNKEGKIELTFKENEITRSIYQISDMGTIYLNIKTNELKIEENKIYIEYEIIESNDKHIYSLEYEVI